MKKSKKKKRFAVTAVFIGSIATIVAFLIVTFVNHGKSDNNENIIESTAGETSTQESESSKNVTSKGYKIENIDGVTYINNIMIVITNATKVIPFCCFINVILLFFWLFIFDIYLYKINIMLIT